VGVQLEQLPQDRFVGDRRLDQLERAHADRLRLAFG
jgi:hypothetical protein